MDPTPPMDTVRSPDGTEIAVWSSGSGPPLLLVHGTAADHRRWGGLVPLLDGDFTVLALDRRGRGGSGDNPPYRIEREGEDVAAAAEWVGGPVAVLGHSYGALCALEAAVRTSAIHHLILYEPPLPVGAGLVPEEVHRAVARQLELGEPEQALIVFFREVVRAPEEQLRVLRAHPAWPARVAAAHTLTREMRVEEEYRPDLARLAGLATPTTLLLGGESPAAFREATARLAAALPNSRVVEMPGQRHVAMDVIPEEFARLVREACSA